MNTDPKNIPFSTCPTCGRKIIFTPIYSSNTYETKVTEALNQSIKIIETHRKEYHPDHTGKS